MVTALDLADRVTGGAKKVFVGGNQRPVHLEFSDRVGATHRSKFGDQFLVLSDFGVTIAVVGVGLFAIDFLRHPFHHGVNTIRRHVHFAECERKVGCGSLDVARLRQQVRMGGGSDAVFRVAGTTERLRQELCLALLERGEIGFREQRTDIGIGEHLFVKAVDDRGDCCFSSQLRVERIGTANRRCFNSHHNVPLLGSGSERVFLCSKFVV